MSIATTASPTTGSLPAFPPADDSGFPSAHSCEPANPFARRPATVSSGENHDPRRRGKSPPVGPPDPSHDKPPPQIPDGLFLACFTFCQSSGKSKKQELPHFCPLSLSFLPLPSESGSLLFSPCRPLPGPSSSTTRSHTFDHIRTARRSHRVVDFDPPVPALRSVLASLKSLSHGSDRSFCMTFSPGVISCEATYQSRPHSGLSPRCHFI